MRQELSDWLAALRGYFVITLQPDAELLERQAGFLEAKHLVRGPVWSLLQDASPERRSVAIMLRIALSNLSFIPREQLGLTKPTEEQLKLFVDIVDILGQENVSQMDERDVDERLRAVGLEVGLEIDDLDAFKVDEGDMGEGD